MARIARIVLPGLPHLITQHGNNDETLFRDERDYQQYRDLLSEEAKRNYVEVWAWTLLPDRVHLLVTPSDQVGLSRCLGNLTRLYALYANKRHGRTGHLFQDRYSSILLDEEKTESAFRYIALSPTRQRLSNRAEDWPWSSLRANLGLEPDGVITAAPLKSRMNIESILSTAPDPSETAEVERREGIGRPWGSPEFIAKVEAKLGRSVTPKKRGRKAAQVFSQAQTAK